MKEQLTKEVLWKILAWLENAEGFAVEQAPLLAQEILAFGFWGNLILALLSVLVGYFTYRVLRRELDHRDVQEWAIGFSVVFSMVAVVVFLGSLFSLVKVVLAPRLYLIEKLARLL